jgi:formylglycine-generating enzyme required for sulfatase activity
VREGAACDPSGPGYTDFDRPRQPINGIRWFDADKYCKAQGKQLPTEAQWEKAARGPDGALHPWGDEPATCERAIIKDEQGRSCGVKKLYSKPETGRPFEVGSRPAYRYGLHDMAGNSWEWVADWYARTTRVRGGLRGGRAARAVRGAEQCAGYQAQARARGLVVLGRGPRDGDLPPAALPGEPALSSLRVSLRGQPGPRPRRFRGAAPGAAARARRGGWLTSGRLAK